MAPAMNISRPPGRQIPRTATIAPNAPFSFCPTRMAMFVAFKPGRLWLIDSISTNSLSLSQACLLTRLLRRYGTTPPKLVAPIVRNSRNMRAIETPPALNSTLFRNSGFASTSLMGLRSRSLEAVHHAGLGYAKRKPVLYLALQHDVELDDKLFLLFRDVLLSVELDLEGELPHQRQVFTAGPPQRDVAFGEHALAEVQFSQREKYFLDNPSIDQLDALATGLLELCQSRKDSIERRHGRLVFLRDLAQAELTIVGIEEPITADLILERQRLRLELDSVLAIDLRPHVQGGCLLLFGVTKLEDDLRVAGRETVNV